MKVIWGNKEHTKLVPDPENWHNLLWIIDMAKRKYTLGEIIVDLVSAGVRRPDGGEWTHDCLSRLLRHTALLGWTSRGWRSESRFLHKAEVVVCKDAHPAALTEEEREQIIQLLESRNRQAKPARSNRSSNPVSDRCVCGVCGNSMQVHDDGKHIRLMCVKNRRTKRLKPDGKPERCPNKSVRLDVFIEKTIEAIMNHILTRPVLRRQIKLVESANKDAIAEHEEGRKRIKKRRTALAKEIANIVGNIAKYGGSKTLRIELDKREEEDGLLQAQLEMMQENIRNALKFINDPELTIANALNLRTYLESEDPHDLKMLLVSLINRASFLNKKVTLEYVVPLPKNGTEEPILSELITLDPKTCPSVLRTGMNHAKTPLLTDTFRYAKRNSKKQKLELRADNTKARKLKTPKEPVPKRIPLTPEERRERQRAAFKEKLEKAKSFGLCRHCGEPAIDSQTRCDSCAEKHRISRREHDRKRRSTEPPTLQTTPPVPPSEAPEPAKAANQRRPKRATEPSAPPRRQQRPERQEAGRRSAQENRQRAKQLGLCRHCSAEAIPGQTRCETCAEKHRENRRKSYAVLREKQKAERQLNNEA